MSAKPRSIKIRHVEAPPASTPPDSRLTIGRARGHAAIMHIEASLEQLEAAMRDLSSVVGASGDYRTIAAAHRNLKAAREKIRYETIESYQFDRDPRAEDGSHGCGCYGKLGAGGLLAATRRALTGVADE